MLCFSFSPVASADRGSIPFEPFVTIHEPLQKAAIAWNGDEEILILSTDLKSSKPTKVLEVLPLPAEPVVTKGDNKIFGKLQALAFAKSRPVYSRSTLPETSKGPGAAEITFHEKIGAHDISVVHLLDSADFEVWVQDFLKKNGVGAKQVSPVLLATISQYILDGYRWFVFDVVDLGTTIKTNDAIQYRFASKQLYYPLRISATDTGKTEVRLATLTPVSLSKYLALPSEKVQQVTERVWVGVDEIAAIQKDLALFFAATPVALQIFQIEGDLHEFDLDLLMR
jgi:hypothetical protein